MNATDGLAQIHTLATNTALSSWSFASDFLIILVLLGILLLLAWYAGRGPFVALLVAFYGAYALYATFPYVSRLPAEPATTALIAQTGLYAALVLLFFIILRRVVASDFLYIGAFGFVVLSFLAAAFLIALAYHVFPVADVYRFTPALDAVFAQKSYFFWWFLAPAVGLFFFAR